MKFHFTLILCVLVAASTLLFSSYAIRSSVKTDGEFHRLKGSEYLPLSDDTSLMLHHPNLYRDDYRLLLAQKFNDKLYYLQFAVLLLLVYIVSMSLAHWKNFRREKEQINLLFLLWSPFVIAILAICGLNFPGVKILVMVQLSLVQIYSAFVVLCFWNLTHLCHPHIEALPSIVNFGRDNITLVTRLLYGCIILRCTVLFLTCSTVYSDSHLLTEIGCEIVLVGFELVTHYWLDLFFHAVPRRKVYIHTCFEYIKMLGFISFQDTILKMLCGLFYVAGVGKLFNLGDVPVVHNVLLLVESFALAYMVPERFTAAAYYGFLVDTRRRIRI